jgi:hypothetical protein
MCCEKTDPEPPQWFKLEKVEQNPEIEPMLLAFFLLVLIFVAAGI